MVGFVETFGERLSLWGEYVEPGGLRFVFVLREWREEGEIRERKAKNGPIIMTLRSRSYES